MKKIMSLELTLVNTLTGKTTITTSALNTATSEATLGGIQRLKEIATSTGSRLECRIKAMKENLVGIQFTY